ncbi:MAG: adenylate/guanylate cyclase domain-containing protein [Thermodesulfobacteriota bacterium]|nr:adenylate/guanylate cyclase domain-containing protein [Thermodesulfobacteriota bacterium]
MSRFDCISNRNTKIITAYTENLLGLEDKIFYMLPFPEDRYQSAKEYLADEDEWTTYDTFQKVFRRAKEIVGDPDFFFNCGASTARLHSWGRFGFFIQLFSGPDDGIKRIPFFNKNLDDTKDIEIIKSPTYDKKLKKINAILRITFHKDQDPNKDYIGDPYLRGIISSIPTLWGLPPASIKQPLNQYNPKVLFNEEKEFLSFKLDPHIEEHKLTIYSPIEKKRKVFGREVLLEPSIIDGRKVFMGRFSELDNDIEKKIKRCTGILITESLKIDNKDILIAGEIYNAPSFILDITYDRLNVWNKLFQFFYKNIRKSEQDYGMIDTINRLREAIISKDKAHEKLKDANLNLTNAKKEIDKYAKNLEGMVQSRTNELRKAKEDLLNLNRGLEKKVDEQVKELKRYSELRRYLSPKITDRILLNDKDFSNVSRRKLMSILFVDIRGFSNLTDSVEPDEIILLLNNYLSEMTKLIYRYDGTLDKIIGDGLMVFFGDPVSIPDHAQKAVLLAIDMQRKINKLKDEWLSYGHVLSIGVGINTGYMTVGNIGSKFHKDYTVIGRQVNVASRLESMAKPGEILISERTYERVKNIADYKKMGPYRLRGISSPILIYSVVYK